MIFTTIQGCPSCNLCFYYPVMLVDDLDVLRVIGQPLDRCSRCGLCYDCHQPHMWCWDEVQKQKGRPTS